MYYIMWQNNHYYLNPTRFAPNFHSSLLQLFVQTKMYIANSMENKFFQSPLRQDLFNWKAVGILQQSNWNGQGGGKIDINCWFQRLSGNSKIQRVDILIMGIKAGNNRYVWGFTGMKIIRLFLKIDTRMMLQSIAIALRTRDKVIVCWKN